MTAVLLNTAGSLIAAAVVYGVGEAAGDFHRATWAVVASWVTIGLTVVALALQLVWSRKRLERD
jgi:Zn-dependent protease with chaperone function